MTLFSRMVLISCALFATSASYSHEWKPLGKQNENGTQYLIDDDSIVQERGLVFVWTLENRNKHKTIKLDKTEFAYRSFISYRGIDCKHKKSNVVRGSYFEQQNGHGENLYNFEVKFKPSELESKIPNSWGDAIIEFVCNPNERTVQKTT